jgi:hypothetical protein
MELLVLLLFHFSLGFFGYFSMVDHELWIVCDGESIFVLDLFVVFWCAGVTLIFFGKFGNMFCGEVYKFQVKKSITKFSTLTDQLLSKTTNPVPNSQSKWNE